MYRYQRSHDGPRRLRGRNSEASDEDSRAAPTERLCFDMAPNHVPLQVEAAIGRAVTDAQERRPLIPAEARGHWLDRGFGGKRAFIRHASCTIALHLGRYKKYEAVEWNLVSRLVFVCKGNICRSAYAQAKAEQMGLRAVSAGLEARQQGAADQAAIMHALTRNVRLDGHRTTPFSMLEILPGDLVVCMEPGQARTVARARSDPVYQLTVLGLWSQPLRPYLQDPYGLLDAYWNACLAHIDSALVAINSRLEPHARAENR
jgi:protein-tyrosine phosphatase